MMKAQSYYEMVIGIVLTFVVLFPSAVQLTHVIEEHQHSSCFNNSIHIHEKQIDCDIQDYQATSFQFDPIQEIEINVCSFYDLSLSSYQYLPFLSYKKYINGLRAPPSFS